MSDGETRPDRTVRRAALWATAVAVPVTVLVGALLVASFSDRAAPAPPPSGVSPAPATAPVTMAAPDLPERPAAVCRALLARLPRTVRGLPQRPVTAGPEQNAAYGEPPVTVACGGPAPSVAAQDFLYTTDGVCWHAAAGGPGTVFTTVAREVPVRVTVPSGFGQPAQWANEFSASVVAAIRSAGTAPSGCGG